jgi:hypothetical protein
MICRSMLQANAIMLAIAEGRLASTWKPCFFFGI